MPKNVENVPVETADEAVDQIMRSAMDGAEIPSEEIEDTEFADTESADAGSTGSEIAASESGKKKPTKRAKSSAKKTPAASETDSQEAEDEAENAADSDGAGAAGGTTRREVMARMASQRSEREQRIEAEQRELTKESSLKNAISRGTVMSGKIVSVETLELGENKEIAVSVLLDKTTKVVIPFGELYASNPIDMSTLDLETPTGNYQYLRRKRQFAEKMIGATISFCLTNLYRDDGVFNALGSRRQALQILRKNYFMGELPRYKVGDIVSATITSVAVHSVAVTLGGVDVVIPQYRLTLRWLLNLHDHYQVGQKINARIADVKINGDEVSVRLDPIFCELEDAKERNRLLADGSMVKGIVTAVYRPEGQNRIYIYAWLPMWDIPARVLHMSANDFGREITAGTQLRLRVSGHDTNGRVSCVAMSEHGNSAMFDSIHG